MPLVRAMPFHRADRECPREQMSQPVIHFLVLDRPDGGTKASHQFRLLENADFVSQGPGPITNESVSERMNGVT